MVDIDTQKIQGELQELAGRKPKVKVGLSHRLQVATSIRETDQGVKVKFNPKRFRSPAKYEDHLNFCREAVGGKT